MLGEKLCRRGIPAYLHPAKVVCPPCVKVGRSDEGDVGSEVTVRAGAIVAYVDSIPDTCPRWAVSLAIEADLSVYQPTVSDFQLEDESHLVGFLCLQDLEDLVRFLLGYGRCGTHGGDRLLLR